MLCEAGILWQKPLGIEWLITRISSESFCSYSWTRITPEIFKASKSQITN
jgi:hypothetical protein